VPLPLPTPPASTPLTSAAPRPSAPQRPAGSGSGVTVFDEQEYTWKNNDTFADISKQYYQSDVYANALQRYNRDHARATAQMNNTGTPTPGERIYIPQAYILEQRHADAISKPAAPPTGFVAPNSTPPLTPTPTPVTPPSFSR
jgi:hypothetical protein